jgi:integrase
VLARLVYPKLGQMPISTIRRSDLARLLDHIADKNGMVMADRTLAYIGRIMNWHASRSDDFRSPIVRGMARTTNKERARDRVLTDDELRAIWQAAEAAQGPFGSFVRFLLLTGARRGEAAEMKWDEMKDGVWTLPASRNKVKLELARPLSPGASAILAKLPRVGKSGFVFTTGSDRPIGAFAKFRRELSKTSSTSGWTLHDLRRTARSLMSRAGVSYDIAERCLGHVMPGVRGVYDRHKYLEEMRHAYEMLAALIQRIIDPQQNVVPLHDARLPAADRA